MYTYINDYQLTKFSRITNKQAARLNLFIYIIHKIRIQVHLERTKKKDRAKAA